MKNNGEIVFKGQIPKKNRLMLFILFSRVLILIPFVRWLIKKHLKNCSNVSFIPGFRYLYGNIYANNVAFNDTFLMDYAPIHIGENSKFGLENMLITSTHDRDDFNIVRAKPIIIGNNVWVTTRCIIIGGVKIGDNSVIGAGSVVTKNIPANCFAAGNPCKVIKHFKD